MPITSGFFNSVNGDRVYNADDMSNYFEGIVSDGVYESIGDRLIVTAGEGMIVNVGTGRALLDCKWLKNDAVYPLQIEAADVQLHRWDTIAIELNMTTREMTIKVIKGSLMSVPVVPNIPNTSTTKYLILAHVLVRPGATVLSQSDIADQRGSVKCPWVTGVIKQVDTSDLFLQYYDAYAKMLVQMQNWQMQRQAAFEQWFSGITESLHVDTSLRKYEQSYVTKTTTTTIPLIENYASGDILLVHINGVLFTEGTEYTISESEIVLTNDITANNTVTQILIKSEIGAGVVAKMGDAVRLTDSVPTEAAVAGAATIEAMEG